MEWQQQFRQQCSAVRQPQEQFMQGKTSTPDPEKPGADIGNGSPKAITAWLAAKSSAMDARNRTARISYPTGKRTFRCLSNRMGSTL